MGMSTHVKGFKLPDEKWEKMREVYDSCENAGIEVPDEVVEYFDGEPPDPEGVEVKIPVTKWSPDKEEAEGYEVKVSDIPKDVKVLRFYNAW